MGKSFQRKSYLSEDITYETTHSHPGPPRSKHMMRTIQLTLTFLNLNMRNTNFGNRQWLRNWNPLEIWVLSKWHHVLAQPTWEFSKKRYPHGYLKKHNASFCVRGDQKVDWVNAFETCALVVSWITVRFFHSTPSARPSHTLSRSH